jgi:hypothetical protein
MTLSTDARPATTTVETLAYLYGDRLDLTLATCDEHKKGLIIGFRFLSTFLQEL